MRGTYTLIGLGFLILSIGGWYAFSRSSPPLQDEPPTLTNEVTNNKPMQLTSSAFAHGAEIPSKYTCEGENVSPPLLISNIPEGTQSLALIMHDPDIPKNLKSDGIFDHWVMFNITPTTTEIGENEAPGLEGKNSAGRMGFIGSCPPKEYEPARHRYIFTLYALRSELPLPQGVSKADVLEAMEGLIIEKAELMGTYEKKQ